MIAKEKLEKEEIAELSELFPNEEIVSIHDAARLFREHYKVHLQPTLGFNNCFYCSFLSLGLNSLGIYDTKYYDEFEDALYAGVRTMIREAKLMKQNENN